MRGGAWPLVPPTLAALGFLGAVAAFAVEMRSFRSSVLDWAKSDIDSRTHLAVAQLREPLRTGDFRSVRTFGDRCRDEGLRLVVTGKPRGRVFDTEGTSSHDGDYLFGESVDADDFVVRLARHRSLVLAPFNRARLSFVMAAVAGVTGVLFFFFATYRQRVRIRELKRLERFRREFIADVSHEIKTPLTGIIGAVDMLEGDSPLKSIIKKESVRLNSLVQSILDLARLEREGDVISRAPIDLADLVSEVVVRYPTCRLGAIRQCVANVDAQLISQALANLIANAVRHSGSDDITVSLDVDGDEARIAVEDHGSGIPPAERERVFERFHRVDPARAAETGGAGLGLAIVRRIARLHGGDVTLEPANPHGCRFTISFALRRFQN